MTLTRSTPIPDRESIGPYRILSPFDHRAGCYVAEESATSRPVVLTIVPLDAARRPAFLREARLATRLDHENIIALVDAGEMNGICYLVTELPQGEALSARLKREHRLGLDTAIRIAHDVAAALVLTHARGLIHRDLSPAHIWVNTAGKARLGGFGSATSESSDPLLQRFENPGTPSYLAPEQATGETIHPATDLFSLGCVLYQMLTGECPFQGDNSAALFRAIVFDQPRPARSINPEISSELENLLTGLLAKMPEDRPTTAVVEQRLRAMLSNVTPQPEPKPPAPSYYPASKRILESRISREMPEPPAPVGKLEILTAPPPVVEKRGWVADLIAALLLLASAGGLYYWWKTSNEPVSPPAVNKSETKP